MDKLVLELKHCTSDVDTSRVGLMLREIDQLAERFDYKIRQWGTKEHMTKVLVEESKTERPSDRDVPVTGTSLAA